MQVLVFISMN